MRRKILLVFALVVVAQLPLFAEWNNIANLKVAVLDLNNRMPDEELDTVTLSEMLQMHLVNENAFQIVERALIERILEEQQFQVSGVTESDMMKIGALAGANKIIAGTVSKIGDTYYLLIKGMDSVTGIIDLSDQVMAKSIDDLLAVLPVLAERIVDKARGFDVALYTLPGSGEMPGSETTISGTYSIDGTNPDGSTYTGEVRISEQNGAYKVIWYIADGSEFYGIGSLDGDLLTVDWGDAYPVLYRINPGGVLDGTWANGSAFERLTPN